LKVLVACEYSGAVRDAFLAHGHDAMSCDLLPTDVPGPHYQGDVFDIIGDGWDLMVAHPPCTHMARSGMRWLKDQPPLKSGKLVGAERRAALADALAFFNALLDAPIPKIAVENPRSFLIPIPATQYVQPWMFGHGEVKATGLWLKKLPPLAPTNIVEGREAKVHKMSPGPDRWKERSTTYPGLAKAMADQWSNP
jgi:hypothetical protein